jgi:hypothetical protein
MCDTYLQRKAVEENHLQLKVDLKELLTRREQLRREIEIANEKGIPTLLARRKLAAVNKDIAQIKRRETKGNLFDIQLNLF